MAKPVHQVDASQTERALLCTGAALLLQLLLVRPALISAPDLS